MSHSICHRQKQQKALLKACRIVGSQKRLSKALEITPSRLNKWISYMGDPEKMKKIPVRYAEKIEELTQGQVQCCDLIGNLKLRAK